MPRPGKITDLTGQRFGRLVALRVDRRGPRRRTFWRCRCECGEESVVELSNLRSGNTTSCGCADRERRFRPGTHGESRRVGRPASPEYQSWASMWTRCTNPAFEHYANYGGRGITVCDRWRSFEAFLADMGRRPSSAHSLDRIGNGGNYEPGNCRWATRSEQARNQRPRRRRT